MQKWILVTAAAALTVSLTACGTGKMDVISGPQSNSAQSASSTVQSDGPFAKFTATDLAGNAVDESVLAENKITMINVWATFCGPCLSEMPDLGVLHGQYADKGVQVIGIVTDIFDSKGQPDSEQVALAKQIVEETGADYLHLQPSVDMLGGPLRDVSVVPTTFFVDAQGNLLAEPYLGANSKEEWSKMLDSLLEVA